jgi:hypothetical protein
MSQGECRHVRRGQVQAMSRVHVFWKGTAQGNLQDQTIDACAACSALALIVQTFIEADDTSMAKTVLIAAIKLCEY